MEEWEHQARLQNIEQRLADLAKDMKRALDTIESKLNAIAQMLQQRNR
jgi:hypothetical protein